MDDPRDSLAVVQAMPPTGELQRAYKEDIAELGAYLYQSRRAYENRRNIWAGKTEDLRKHGSDPFPWEGASDVEAAIIDEKIRAYTALFKQALKRANIRAYPTELGDAATSRLASAFVKWMVRSYIPGFLGQMERGGSYFLEKGLMVSYVGWESKTTTQQQTFTLDQIAEASPDLAAMIANGGAEDQFAAMLQTAFPKLSKRRAKKAARDLQKTGEAVLTVGMDTVSRPVVEALAPDSDVFWPAWCLDPQRSPRVSRRVFLTEQEVRNRIESEGWDKDWAEYVIEHHRGVDPYQIEEGHGLNERITLVSNRSETGDLYEIIYMYRRLIDTEDGSEGIYCTVFHPDFTGSAGVPEHAKHELLDRVTEYPFEVTRLTEDGKRMYDLKSFADILKSTQWEVKKERDARIDAASMDTLPPLMGPAGRRPQHWRPGGYVPRRRADEYDYAPRPTGGQKSMEVETTLIKQADLLVGLDPEDPLAPVKQAHYVDKFLEHVQGVIRKAYKAFLMYGPEEVFFRVTGYPEQQQVTKDQLSEEFDINISFDVLNNDPEALDKKIRAFFELWGFDRTGKIDADGMIELAAYSLDPQIADAVLQPSDQAQDQMIGTVTSDLSKIYSGIEVGAQPNGAAVAMQVIQAYVSQPDIADKLANDEFFAERMQKYAGQYQMQMTQMQNAHIGRLGTAPAMFQGSNVG